MAASMIPANVSLVRYDNPVLVTKHTEKKTPYAKDKTTVPVPPEGLGPVPTAAQSGLSKRPGHGDAKQDTEEVLNSIIPPREWEEEGGQLWRQQVSTTPATRLDVLNLQEQLDMKLQQRQARETGICPVRRELYSQAFDEVIRQVTINCAERGLLLLRIRDELRMTLSAYQTLYESSCAFGMRKALQAEQGKEELEASIAQLEVDKEELLRQVTELRAKCDQIERRAQEQRQAEERKHAEEIQFLKRTNQQLKTQLEGIIAPKK
ncbi:33 kDa inner dynein arm light chain, axonemal-like [Amphibalanus amphitrite]|uniref:33 kDa inner dynein arm light chain, axonemal-like n=1 Tax=Amphibalanus amphitrite TaxID=1232801 RepID=UPI001C921287|nr:33 kDa inner dynein arm light chain, axonemal-like [Amphibalanus amphitrite]